MAVEITYQGGKKQIIRKAVKVDQTNYHEGMIDLVVSQNLC